MQDYRNITLQFISRCVIAIIYDDRLLLATDKLWSERQVSNLWPRDLEPRALPSELLPENINYLDYLLKLHKL